VIVLQQLLGQPTLEVAVAVAVNHVVALLISVGMVDQVLLF
jgi:hypothetical protein